MKIKKWEAISQECAMSTSVKNHFLVIFCLFFYLGAFFCSLKHFGGIRNYNLKKSVLDNITEINLRLSPVDVRKYDRQLGERLSACFNINISGMVHFIRLGFHLVSTISCPSTGHLVATKELVLRY